MEWLITFDRLPKTANINGKIHEVSYGYRTMMAAEIEMFRPDISDQQKMLNALNLFYAYNIPSDLDAAVDYMLWFHRCGELTPKGDRTRKGVTRRGYCFLKDAPLIYAAFRQQYGINLRQTPNDSLHWWEFLAMFEALDENTRMAKVMYWRTCDTKGMGKEQKAYIKQMRTLYSLEEPQATMDSRLRLAKRNADMRAYVKRRMEECRNG